MAALPTLIYCGGGNRRFADIAIAAGFRFGSCLPETVYHPLYFADQDWKRPNRAAYMAALAQHRPAVATVLDWESEEQLPTVLEWAEEAATFTQSIIIIPKVLWAVNMIPPTLCGKPIVLGFSVPTKYGGTPCQPWEFAGRRVHLLGGSPHRQMAYWRTFQGFGAEVVSADGNMAQKMSQRNKVWTWDTAKSISEHRYWPALAELNGEKWGEGAPYEAWRRSCQNIAAAWRDLGK